MKTMSGESLAFEGVVDVGILVMAHFENPATEEALVFLRKVLSGDIRAAIPTTTLLGAYHVMTRYLHVSPLEAGEALGDTLSMQSSAFFESVRKEAVQQAMIMAPMYNTASWDAFYLSLARHLGTRVLFSLDEELKRKTTDFVVVNPIREQTMKKYNAFIARIRKKKRNSNERFHER